MFDFPTFMKFLENSGIIHEDTYDNRETVVTLINEQENEIQYLNFHFVKGNFISIDYDYDIF